MLQSALHKPNHWSCNRLSVPLLQAIPDDRERRELFDEALRERTKRERKAKEEELKRKEAAFKELLLERGIKVTSQWRKVQAVSGACRRAVGH